MYRHPIRVKQQTAWDQAKQITNFDFFAAKCIWNRILTVVFTQINLQLVKFILYSNNPFQPWNSIPALKLKWVKTLPQGSIPALRSQTSLEAPIPALKPQSQLWDPNPSYNPIPVSRLKSQTSGPYPSLMIQIPPLWSTLISLKFLRGLLYKWQEKK